MKLGATLLLTLALAACAGSPASDPAASSAGDGWTSLFDGRTLGAWKRTEYGGEGEVRVVDGCIQVDQGAGVSGLHWTGAPLPTTNYELELEAMKVDGSDFFLGIVFPVEKSHCSFVAGGWGGGVTGLSSVDQMNASENETASVRDYEKNRWYKTRLKVTPEKIEIWIDNAPVVNLELKDRQITVHPAVEMACPFGLTNYTTTSRFRNLRWRPIR
jgi:hypothetical protein